MHLPEILPSIKSKTAVSNLAQACLSAESVSELIAYLGHVKLAPKAAWVLSHVFDQEPALAKKHELMLLQTLETTPHSAVARFILRFLITAEIDKQNQSMACEIALAYLEDPKQPVGPKVFAMRTAWRFSTLAQKEEIIALIEQQLPRASAGFKSCARKILKHYQVVKKESN